MLFDIDEQICYKLPELSMKIGIPWYPQLIDDFQVGTVHYQRTLITVATYLEIDDGTGPCRREHDQVG